MAETHYDLTVIGAGPGGYIAAIRAAQLGLTTAIVDKDATLGGTCLNIGCIPSKALLESSERFHAAREDLQTHGVRVAGVELDLATMMARKTEIVGTLTKGIAGLMKKNRIAVITGTARIAAANSVEVTGADGAVQALSTDRILIATGSAPIELPHLPFDGARVISSTEALSLDAVPGRMLVVGAGAIGLELGSVWSRLGSEVVVVELLDQVVPGADKRMATLLQRSLKKQGLDIRLNTSAVALKTRKADVEVTLESKGKQKSERFDVVLVSVGRRPYTAGLGLEEIGVALDERGRVVVDEGYATNVQGIYAVGDVKDGPMLAHKAEDEGVACVERMAGVAGHVNYDAIPSVVYTWPELASVGMSEERAKEAGRSIKTGQFPFQANARARCSGMTDGAVKIIADAETDEILGVHIVGPGASELIAEAAIGVEFRAAAEDLARSTHAHPTLAEAIKEAALAVDGRALNI